MKNLFADRMNKVHKSFIREILKVTEDPNIISFGGGLPNPKSFPVTEIKEVVSKVLSENGEEVLQYSTTEGYLPLREYIAQRYAKEGLMVHADEILITNGSQQGIDLISKVFLNKGDNVLVEKPTYLAAIQSFGLFEPKFKSVPLLEDGADINAFQRVLDENKIKIFYSVTNFQNPTGITYSKEKRQQVAEILQNTDTIFVEDNPYGEIRFMGEDIPPVKSYLEDGILLGSFSKIVSPGMRLGWIVANKEIMDKIIIAKQASDLHSNYFTQRVVYQYLIDNDVDEHIEKIKKMYKKQRNLMVKMIEQHFPDDVNYTKPEGGMFLWVTLPEGLSSLDLFDIAIKENVAFVPGKAFFADGSGNNTLRLNFSNSNEEKIEEGIKRLGKAIYELMGK
ncbi:MAG: PLP-dependent aminotransferase family protein [Methanobacterium sp.]|uniref:aminotransferase-like domain-containing protein n=1 Tax=Methanobacterium sp. TaxID=2164 RepID=UPI003D64D737|nr:PLP-dependent aminotransferase family protein [Methanobacterium sp.]